MQIFSRQRGPTAYLTTVQQVQAHFGFSQQELADLLGVSRAALSLVGRENRTLPLAAWERLLLFVQVLPPAEIPGVVAPIASAPLPALTERQQRKLDLRRRGLELQVLFTSEELARCQTRLTQARLRLQTLPGLRAVFPADAGLAQLCFAQFEQAAAITLRDESGTPALLTLRLAVLRFEAAEIKRLLGGGVGGGRAGASLTNPNHGLP